MHAGLWPRHAGKPPTPTGYWSYSFSEYYVLSVTQFGQHTLGNFIYDLSLPCKHTATFSPVWSGYPLNLYPTFSILQY